MSDIFEIVPKSTGKPKLNKIKENIVTRYTLLQGDFLSRSYGYYTNHFIHKIASEAIEKNIQIEVLSVCKLLRDLVRKFILSDLQLVFIGYIANALEWNFAKSFYKFNYQHLKSNSDHLHKNIEILNFFLNLIAYFVKNYIGQMDEAGALMDFINFECEGQWEGVYEEWLKNCPAQMFNLSPRAINGIFSNYTRDCQKTLLSKNYNAMVDRILELSTTYSMMPGQIKQEKKKESAQMIEEPSRGRKRLKKNIITQGFMSNMSKRQSSLIDPAMFSLDSRLENTPKGKDSQAEPKGKKVLRLKTRNQQVSNHVSQFYSKKQYDLPGGRDEFRPQSTIGFQNNPMPSFLDFNNRSSVYEAIPYTLKNNSNLSSFWK